jgi:RimJ/RimL family protein N-acetyltransferase
VTVTAVPRPGAHSEWLASSKRLRLRRLGHDDLRFLIALLNDDQFVRFVGDRGVRTLDDARHFLDYAVVDSYRRYGFGPYLVLSRTDGARVGLCGLYRRDYLTVPDLGYALLAKYRGLGLAGEAARLVLDYGRRHCGVDLAIGIVDPDNHRSAAVLRACGMSHRGAIRSQGAGAGLLSDVYAPQWCDAALADLITDCAEIVR